MPTINCEILALESNVFITKESVTSENEMHKESFSLLKFITVESTLQLEVVFLLLLLLLLLSLLQLSLFEFINRIRGYVFAISLSKNNAKKN